MSHQFKPRRREYFSVANHSCFGGVMFDAAADKILPPTNPIGLVCAIRCAEEGIEQLTSIPVAIALRHTLIKLFAARQASEGQQTKMEMIYQYLTGPRFRHRIQAIVEKFADMQEDLDRERKTMTKLWAKRQEQIRCVVESTAGMCGDMQAIAGTTLLEIEGLEVRLIEEDQNTA